MRYSLQQDGRKSELDSVEATLERMCGEYLEMPGLRLTVAQARRLWSLDEPTCVHLLNALLETGFLRLTRDGTYARATDGPADGPRQFRMAKAAIGRSLAAAPSRS